MVPGRLPVGAALPFGARRYLPIASGAKTAMIEHHATAARTLLAVGAAERQRPHGVGHLGHRLVSA